MALPANAETHPLPRTDSAHREPSKQGGRILRERKGNQFTAEGTSFKYVSIPSWKHSITCRLPAKESDL